MRWLFLKNVAVFQFVYLYIYIVLLVFKSHFQKLCNSCKPNVISFRGNNFLQETNIFVNAMQYHLVERTEVLKSTATVDECSKLIHTKCYNHLL